MLSYFLTPQRFPPVVSSDAERRREEKQSVTQTFASVTENVQRNRDVRGYLEHIVM